MLKEIRTKLILNVVSPPLALTKQPYPGGLNDINIKNIVHALFDEAIEISQLIGWDLDLETNSQLNNFHKMLVNKMSLILQIMNMYIKYQHKLVWKNMAVKAPI